jgi:hypothetical protein
MTDQKPNCSDCTNDDCPIHPNGLPFPEEVRYEINVIQEHTKEMGCLSNPGAREWLMKDVIEELERRGNGHPTSSYIEGLFDGYDEAIPLIRGEK